MDTTENYYPFNTTTLTKAAKIVKDSGSKTLVELMYSNDSINLLEALFKSR
jgi:hypothetical protein